jgi:hypothetical protein
LETFDAVASRDIRTTWSHRINGTPNRDHALALCQPSGKDSALPLLDEGREKAWFTAYFISGFAGIKGTIYVSDKA